MADINKLAEMRKWKKDRLGKVTASRFDNIQMTERKEVRHEKGSRATKGDKLQYIQQYNFQNLLPEKPQLKDINPIYLACPASKIIEPTLTKTAEAYLNELIGEVLTGQQSVEFTSKATDWGNEYEPFAIEEYEERNGIRGRRSAVAFHPKYKLIGATADRLFKEQSGIAEFKCPYYTKNHVRTLRTREVPKEYRDQVFGQLICNPWAEWNDFSSFDPRIKGENRLVTVRIRREEHKEEIATLENRLIEFLNIYKKELKRLNLSAHNIYSLQKRIAA